MCILNRISVSSILRLIQHSKWQNWCNLKHKINVFHWCFVSLSRTFHLPPDENICTITLITIHYLYIMCRLCIRWRCWRRPRSAASRRSWNLIRTCCRTWSRPRNTCCATSQPTPRSASWWAHQHLRPYFVDYYQVVTFSPTWRRLHDRPFSKPLYMAPALRREKWLH